jgi:peptidoglycan DL-endopeptidase CwlO
VKKSITILMTTVISIGLLGTTITAKPQTLGETLPYELTLADAQIAAEVTPNNDSQTPPATEQVAAPATDTPAQTNVAPRQRVATSQPSRGGQSSSTSTTNKVVTSTTTSSSKASAVIATAKKYIGVSYLWGGTTPSGFDCSGFTQYVFKQNGINLPRVSRDQFNVGTPVSQENLKAGDLVFFSLDGDKVIDHVGIFIGNGQFINSSSSKGVTIYTMGSYWTSKYIGAKRVL